MLTQFLEYLGNSDRALEPVFAEQQNKLSQLLEAHQFLQEETRRAFTLAGEARLPMAVAEPLNQVCLSAVFCVPVCLCACVPVWLCGAVALWLCGSVAL